MTEFQEFPKALYGPEGEEIVVQNAEEAAALLALWGDADEPITPRRGRPPKVR